MSADARHWPGVVLGKIKSLWSAGSGVSTGLNQLAGTKYEAHAHPSAVHRVYSVYPKPLSCSNHPKPFFSASFFAVYHSAWCCHTQQTSFALTHQLIAFFSQVLRKFGY